MKKVTPEAVCIKHVVSFKEIVECMDCIIYPQDQINAQIEDAERRGREDIFNVTEKICIDKIESAEESGYKRGLRKAEDMVRVWKDNDLESRGINVLNDVANALEKYRWTL